VAVEVTPDQEARANDAANKILAELDAAQTADECEAVAGKHAKTFVRLLEVHPVRALHIMNLAGLRKKDFTRAARAYDQQHNQQQKDLFR
jgi:hypothetical protein